MRSILSTYSLCLLGLIIVASLFSILFVTVYMFSPEEYTHDSLGGWTGTVMSTNAQLMHLIIMLTFFYLVAATIGHLCYTELVIKLPGVYSIIQIVLMVGVSIYIIDWVSNAYFVKYVAALDECTGVQHVNIKSDPYRDAGQKIPLKNFLPFFYLSAICMLVLSTINCLVESAIFALRGPLTGNINR